MNVLVPSQTDQVPPALNDPKLNLLRPTQVAEHQQDIRSAEAQLNDPRVQDKGAVRKRLADLKRQTDLQAPRPITDGALKDKIQKESDQLLSEITVGMLSQEEMRKNPAGAVDRHMKWERANKKKILRWKKLALALNADQSDPYTWDRDAANLERFRPVGAQDRMRLDAQIPGSMAYTGVPEENWKEAFGSTHPENSALNQAKKAQTQKGKE